MGIVPTGADSFIVRTSFDRKPDDGISAVAYLFDSKGKLIAQAPLDGAATGKGEAKFALRRGTDAARASLVIGPPIDPAQGPPTLALLKRHHGYAPPFRYVPGTKAYEFAAIPADSWKWWPLCRCRVRGRVVKRVSRNGVTVEAPVCNARVNIFEVDPLIILIPRLPDDIILRLRDDLIDVIRHPLPWPPEPDPWIHLDPGNIDPVPDVLVMRDAARAAQLFGKFDPGKVALNPQPLPPRQAPRRTIPGRVIGNVVTGGPAVPAPAPLEQLPAATRVALASNVPFTVRRALLDNIALVRPYLCRWHWLHPWFTTTQQVATVITGDDGSFDTFVLYPCFGDRPDLYFSVDYAIGGSWTAVYRPLIPCATWWDYPCGTEVVITITDPRVPGCGERPTVQGKTVVVKSIAREVSMGEILREPSPANPAADAAKAGLVAPGWLHATRESPFGAVLEPRVDFGTGLKPAGITHYRWSVRPLGSSSDADWQVIDTPVSRHYREAPPPAAPPGTPTIYKSVQIGPAAGISGYYVEIDPALPAGGEDWEVLDEGYDLASAYWNTNGIDSGKFELKLELFRQTGATMTRVDLCAEGVTVNQIVDPAPFVGGTYVATPATDDRLLTAGASVVGFRLVLAVDNRDCFGTINSVTVAPGNNDTVCGFLEYGTGSLAQIVFRASHPGNFAWFSFTTARVATVLASASASGLVDAGTAGNFTRGGDTFTASLSVSGLLAEGVVPPATPCIRAAFAESLSVYALATNGYGRLSGYDAPQTADPAQVGLRAFAVTPI